MRVFEKFNLCPGTSRKVVPGLIKSEEGLDFTGIFAKKALIASLPGMEPWYSSEWPSTCTKCADSCWFSAKAKPSPAQQKTMYTMEIRPTSNRFFIVAKIQAIF